MTVDFPTLPYGHYYGVNSPDIRAHSGESPVDRYNLEMWQRQYARRFDRNHPVTGFFDGPMQRVVVGLQVKHDLPVSAQLDEAVWDLVMNPDKETAVGVTEEAEPQASPDQEGGDEASEGPTPGVPEVDNTPKRGPGRPRKVM